MKRKRDVRIRVSQDFGLRFRLEALRKGFRGTREYSDFLIKRNKIQEWEDIKHKKKNEKEKGFGFF